uniref:Uncharacterized protein n=1 Tax=Nyssomyia neivai TaxID=330878 RepID=A0A1L8D8K7_9DIPT
MPNIAVNVTKNHDNMLKTLEENVPENSLTSLIDALKTMKESCNSYLTELVNEQQSEKEAPAPIKSANHTEEEDSEEDATSGGASSPKKQKIS